MTKRLIACLMITALLGAGCKKKHAESAGGGSGASEATGANSGASEVTPSPAVAAAGVLATNTQKANADAIKALAAAPVADKVAQTSKLIDATIAAEQSAARDRSWDPASVVAKVGTDRAKLFAWVHGQTALVPYTGTLRGAVGVMMDRVGNNLDRSLLLAELLKQAGGETRLAHATLDPANADKLAAAWPKASRPSFPTTAEDPTAIANLVAAFGGDRAALEKRFAADAAAHAEIATKARAQIDAQVGTLAKMIEATPAATATDSAVLSDHWWVQVKDGEAWTDLDLALDTPGTSLVPAAETMAVDAVPENLQHMVSIRVIGEVWHDTTREEAMLVEHAFAPAQFYGQRLIVSAMPLDLDQKKLDAEKDRPAAARAALVAQTEWAPIIQMGVTPVVKFSVTDTGELYDLTDANGNSNRLARAVSQATKKGVGGATGMLEGMPDGTDGTDGSGQPPPKPVAGGHSGFTAEWIEIEVRTPNTPPRVIRRTVFDELGAPADRSTAKPVQLSDTAKLDRGLALVGETEVLAQVARLPQGFIADRLAKYLVAAKPSILALIQNGGKSPSDEINNAYGQALPPPDELDDLAVLRFGWNASNNAYVDQVDVLTAWRRLQPAAGALRFRKWFDIMTNGVGAWGTPADARKARLAQGIADTIAESVLRPCVALNGPCFRTPNTSDAFVGAKSWVLTTAATSPSVTGLPSAAKVVATKDLADGYSIVAAPDGKPATWWRLRGDTGEILGEGALGGTEGVDYISLMKGMSIGFALATCELVSQNIDQMTACAVTTAIGGSSLFVVAEATAAALGLIAAGLTAALALGAVP